MCFLYFVQLIILSYHLVKQIAFLFGHSKYTFLWAEHFLPTVLTSFASTRWTQKKSSLRWLLLHQVFGELSGHHLVAAWVCLRLCRTSSHTIVLNRFLFVLLDGKSTRVSCWSLDMFWMLTNDALFEVVSSDSLRGCLVAQGATLSSSLFGWRLHNRILNRAKLLLRRRAVKQWLLLHFLGWLCSTPIWTLVL